MNFVCKTLTGEARRSDISTTEVFPHPFWPRQQLIEEATFTVLCLEESKMTAMVFPVFIMIMKKQSLQYSI